jgi:hypothetical protein
MAKNSLPLGQQHSGDRFAGKGRGRLAIDGDGDLFTPLNRGQQLACVRDSHKQWEMGRGFYGLNG